jgi:hypothetical protein
MSHVFGQDFAYGRGGLALLGVGMGLHLISGTLNQAALARGRAALSAACWLTIAALFVGWSFVPLIGDQLVRAEVGYAGATALLAVALYRVYAIPTRTPAPPAR